MISEELKSKNVFLYYDDPSVFVSPQWPLPYTMFLLWRLLWAIWNSAWMCVSIRNEIAFGSGEKWLIYLTNIAYLLLVIHSVWFFLVVLFHKGKTPDATRWYHCSLWLLNTVAFDTALMVTLLYWSLEYKGILRVQSFMTHTINSVYVLLDLAITSIPVRLLHVLYTLILSLVYLIFTVIYHLMGGTNSEGEPYIYRALNWKNTNKSLVISSMVLCAGVPLVHLFQFACYSLRAYSSRIIYDTVKVNVKDEPVQIVVETQPRAH
nr:protein rolling stone [Biomphalaria glabrata]